MYDAVVLVSGGLDSLVAYHETCRTHQRVAPVFINWGQPYFPKEAKSVREIYGYYLEVVDIRGLPPLTGNIFCDGRNLMFATLGLRWSHNIVLGAVKDETCEDKTPEAFERMSHVLTEFSQRQVTVTSPTWHLVKATAVTQYLDTSGDPELLLRTVSCYSGSVGHCLRCSACFRRAVALRYNGLNVPLPHPAICAENLKRIGRLPEEAQDIIRSVVDERARVG